jgi:aldehyde:ferredoxin oxidoreductase
MGPLRGGTILRINLTDGKVVRETTSLYAEKFLGGRGINTSILYQGVGPAVKPYDPENMLIFGVGPLVGSLFPGACRTDVLAKSPVTMAIGNASLGGYWGAELKFAGYDNLVIQGRAAEPVYLSIHNDEVEIRKADKIWGQDCYQTPKIVREELKDPKACIVCIGPAGEKLIRYASINTSMGNVAARTGLGAVMGSKNLKAIAVRGTKGLNVAEPSKFYDECKKLHELIKQAPAYKDMHTVGLTRWQDKEYRAIYSLIGEPWDESLDLQGFLKENLHKRVGCFGCPVGCMDSYQFPEIGGGVVKCSPYADLTWDLRITDMKVFWEVMTLCQRDGIDARSLANIIAWLMELYKNKIITEDDTDGIPMEYGSKEAILEIARKILHREKIGDLLAEGIVEAAKKIGRGSENYIQHAKGSPIDTHIPPLKGVGLATAVSATGEGIKGFIVSEMDTALTIGKIGDQAAIEKSLKKWEAVSEQVAGTKKAADPRLTVGKASFVYYNEDRNSLGDLLGVCTWMTPFIGLPITPDHMAHLLSIGLGVDVSPELLLETSARVRHLQRAFEIREGLNRADDKLAKGFYRDMKSDQDKETKVSLSPEELEKLKDEYYQLRGWDVNTGTPTRETLERFGLKEVADDLQRHGKLPH